jgi:hypothetical protein
MSTPTTTIRPDDKAQEIILSTLMLVFGRTDLQTQFRQRCIYIDRQYQREVDRTEEQRKAKIANRAGDPTKFQNVIVPVVAPQVESAVVYQASVFLTGTPIFGMAARPGYEQLAQQYNALNMEHSKHSGWVSNLTKAIRDGFKYNLGCVEVDWRRETVQSVTTDMTKSAKQGTAKEVIWEGNAIKHIDLYTAYWDMTCHPAKVHEHGDYAGYHEMFTATRLKTFLQNLPNPIYKNFKAAFACSTPDVTQHTPEINMQQFSEQQTAIRAANDINWSAYLGLLPEEKAKPNSAYYEVNTTYFRVVPAALGILNVGAPNTPQIWKFITVNRKVLISVEIMTNAHGYLPMVFMQPYDDSLKYQTKSLAQNAEAFQATASAVVNGAIAARRRAISDRGIYNSNLVDAAHINNDSPTAKIPMKPAAYGQPASAAYYAIPFNDNTSGTAFQEVSQLVQMSNLLAGQNPARQGQFVKGNKTLQEFQSVMQNANGRDQLIALSLEDQFFSVIKHIIKLNILQYQPSGKTFIGQKGEDVVVDPVQLRQVALEFEETDGLIPAEKVLSTDEFAVALQTLASSPGLAGGYNLNKAFTYLFASRNVDLSPFEKSQQQIAYEQAMAQWNQLAQLSIQKGTEFKIPQPNPANYGYKPQ